MEDNEQLEAISEKLDKLETNCVTQAQAENILKKLEEIATEFAEFRAYVEKSGFPVS